MTKSTGWKPKPIRMQNPFNEGSNHTHGQRSETRVLKNIGARQVIASGAFDGMKSDGELDCFRIECKATIKESIGIKLDWLRKIRAEASQQSQLPMMTITFVDGMGKARAGGDWAMIPQHLVEDFAEFMRLRDGV